MIANRILIFAILAIIGHLVRAEEGVFRVYGRDETPVYSDITGPIIFYNLTKDEFNFRVAQHGQFSGLRKRDVYLMESRNNIYQQKVVDLRTAECQEKHPDEITPYRAIAGVCQGKRALSNNKETMHTDCKQPPGIEKEGRKYVASLCPEGRPCDTMRVWRYAGSKQAHMAYCGDEIDVNRAQDHDAPITYEGISPIPDPPNKRRKGNPDKDDEAPLPSWDIPWDPDTSGYYQRVNSHYELYSPFAHVPNTSHNPEEGEETEENPGFRNIKAKWEYRGHWPSTRKTFVHDSQGLAHSWSCLACPVGFLYVTTYGFKAKAIGFSFPASIVP